MSVEDMDTYFAFLDNLRESGSINMFGAAPVLAEMYELNKTEARHIVMRWMETFSERHSNELS